MKKLIFVTSKFPFKSGETFIENEIGFLSKAFDKVYIFATEAEENDPSRPVTENVTAFAADPKAVSKKDYIPCLFKPSCVKEILSHCLGKGMIHKIAAVCYFSACVSASSKRIPDFLDKCSITAEDEVVIYSYWLSTIGMCALKIKDILKSKSIPVKAVSRCHGFDVYADRTDINYLPYQEYLIKCFDAVYPCSKAGELYLQKCYPDQKDKIEAKYLGVPDNFNSVYPKKENVFHIVSCSNVIPLKRVNLIVEALSRIIDKDIIWVHFGDGEGFEDLKKQAEKMLPDNIKYEFKGRVPNTEIYEYYNKNNVNLFVNVSESEGLPVSIMEAISFGIPVVATDVGGTGEIVKDKENGFLLEENFRIEQLEELIISFCVLSEDKYAYLCKNARKTFESTFNAKTNYTLFSEQLINF